jgi:DNA-binding NarL/FixJ family response regulator
MTFNRRPADIEFAGLLTSGADYAVALLEDNAAVWPAVEDLLSGSTSGAHEELGASKIGLLGWTSATREEIDRLPALRAQHKGPLVAVLREMPGALGARTVAARLEGTVLASELEQTLLPTLAAVSAGQCVVPRTIRQIVDRPPLSPRERQILAMIVLDFSNAEIAEKLFVTESNVKNHLSSAFQKLGVKSRSAAAELILNRESGLGPGILHISPEESLPE